MQNYNEEYFYLKRKGSNYPMLNYIKGKYGEGDRVTPLDINEERIVTYSEFKVENPELADFHFIKQHVSVISERLKNVLESLYLKDVQFLPTLVRDDQGNDHDGFYVLHIYNTIECVDKEKSVWTKDPYYDNEEIIGMVDKLVLNNELIDKIPLEQRLVFVSEEERTHLLFHESVVEKILEIEPTGLTIYRLSKYDPDQPFIEEYMERRGL